MNWKIWLHGLAAAAIGAAANAFILCIADPQTFNASLAGLKHVGTVMLVSGGLSAAAYLKQSPVPG